MTVAHQVLRTTALERRIDALFLPAGGARGGPGRVGVEIELLPVRFVRGRPFPVPIADVQAALAHDPGLAGQARISFEPGGQVELSPAPQASPAAALEGVELLIARLRRCAGREGITLVSAAVSPWHDPETIGLANPAPRYRAMQEHFDSIGPWGRRMMRQTAATQVCLDMDGEGGCAGGSPPAGGRVSAQNEGGCAGGSPPAGGRVSAQNEERWRMLNRAGPALAAAFAASPLLDGAPAGLRSARTAIWQGVDLDRTGFDGRHLGDDPAPGYTRLALGAHAIPLPRAEGEPLPTRTPMRRWMATGEGRPDGDDLDHHLTTLFPPVRPRGYLEVRYVDALPAHWLAVPVCVLATLASEPGARRRALEVLESDPTGDDWWRAARSGPADPELRSTALALIDAALAGMRRLDRGYLPATAPALVAEYRDRFVAAGRSPADELLERHTARPEDPSTWM